MGSYHPQTGASRAAENPSGRALPRPEVTLFRSLLIPLSRSPRSVKATLPDPELPARRRKHGLAIERARVSWSWFHSAPEVVRQSRLSGYGYHLNNTPVSRASMFDAVFWWSTVGDPAMRERACTAGSPSGWRHQVRRIALMLKGCATLAHSCARRGMAVMYRRERHHRDEACTSPGRAKESKQQSTARCEL